MDAPSSAPLPTEPSWASARDEELLAMRVCDLGVRIEGSELEPRIAQLHEELAARAIALRPACYLGDEWFAQAHPDEDFAETFAVWLGTPEREWRSRYRKWKALDKLEYVDELMREVASARTPPEVHVPARRIADASRMRKTLARYYAERRKNYAEDYPDV